MKVDLYSYINLDLYKKEAIQLLKENEFEKLDALVGDCSCQIRAAHLLQLHKKIHAGFLNEEEQEFLALCKFLTQSVKITYCQFNYQHKHATHDFKKVLTNCSITKAKALIRAAQQKLAELSVKYMQAESELTAHVELQRCMRHFFIDDEYFNRKICAAYPSMQLILSRMLESKTPMLIKMLKFCFCEQGFHELFFLYKISDDAFKLTDIKKEDLDKPALIVTGYSPLVENRDQSVGGGCENYEGFKKRFERFNCIIPILAWFANHPQYVGNYRNCEIPYSELNLKNIQINLEAHRKLYLEETHKLFSIYHIYASTLRRALISNIPDHLIVRKESLVN